jgi:hypothetical protein
MKSLKKDKNLISPFIPAIVKFPYAFHAKRYTS